MSDRSAIKWTNASWNPVAGCTKLSVGCDHCCADTRAPPHIWLGVSIEDATTPSLVFKRWGGWSSKSSGDLLDGQQWLAYPPFGYAKFSTASH